MRIKILFVDDEENILSSIRRSLRGQRQRWDIDFALGGFEAMELLAETRYDVVISDMRMPGMDGAQLLRYVHAYCPSAFRIILSGQAEEDSIYRAIPVAHQYLSKPCNVEVLSARIERFQITRSAIEDEHVRESCTAIDCVPCEASALQQFESLLMNEVSAEEELVQLVESHPWLSAKLLQLVNSSFFGHVKEVSSVGDAIRKIGIERLKKLAASSEILKDCESGATFCMMCGEPFRALESEADSEAVFQHLLALWNIPAATNLDL